MTKRKLKQKPEILAIRNDVIVKVREITRVRVNEEINNNTLGADRNKIKHNTQYRNEFHIYLNPTYDILGAPIKW